MKNKIPLIILVIVVLLGGFFFIQKKSNTVTVQQKATIKLGLMFPLTSQFGSIAEGVKNASLLAVSDWEESHPNMHVETLVEDDAYDPKKGIAAYNKWKSIDHVDAIVSVSTPVVDALYKTYQTDGIPVINLGVQTTGATRDNIFQIFPDAKEIGRAHV